MMNDWAGHFLCWVLPRRSTIRDIQRGRLSEGDGEA